MVTNADPLQEESSACEWLTTALFMPAYVGMYHTAYHHYEPYNQLTRLYNSPTRNHTVST
jgi:hypothetical protein